jgi:hypothetical protein
MSKFEVITRSTHEHIYWVEANSFVEACEKAIIGDADFVQNHLGETVLAQTRLDDDADFVDWLDQKRQLGYY